MALTYLNDKAKPYVQPLAERIEAELLLPLDVTAPRQVQAVFDALRERWGGAGFRHSFDRLCPKDDLHGRLADCSREASCRPCRFPATPSSKSRTTREA